MIVLDLLMPGVGGMGVLRHLMREQPDEEVLVLSAISDVAAKVRCLDVGAADYLTSRSRWQSCSRAFAPVCENARARRGARLIHAGRFTLDLQRKTVDVASIGLSDKEKDDLVAFLDGLTDPRVATQSAPFDHPQLFVPSGHPTDANGIVIDGGTARDEFLLVPAVGRDGGVQVPTFLNFTGPPVELPSPSPAIPQTARGERATTGSGFTQRDVAASSSSRPPCSSTGPRPVRVSVAHATRLLLLRGSTVGDVVTGRTPRELRIAATHPGPITLRLLVRRPRRRSAQTYRLVAAVDGRGTDDIAVTFRR